MLDLVELFALPFMRRAFLAGALLGVVLPYLGVFTTLRRMSFFGDGIAHASLAGVAIGIAAGLQPFGTAIVVGVLFGIGIFVLEKKTRLSSDAIIGTIFTSGLALGVVILSFERGYQPELISFLFGNILTIGSSDIAIIGALTLVILGFLIANHRAIALTVFDAETAWLSGVRTSLLEFIFYVILSLAVVLGVKLLGIILVSALLIIPPTTAKLFSRSLRAFIVTSIVLGELAIFLGLVFSFIFDLPSGAAIILTSALIFTAALLLIYLKRLFRGGVHR